ncbi:MAG: amidase [Parvularculaceae bacterium]
MSDNISLNRRQTIAGAASITFAACAKRPRSAEDIALLDIGALAAGFRNRALTPADAVSACLSRIERHDGSINAFCHIEREAAFDAAKKAAEKLAFSSDAGPLCGVPVAVKDNIDVKGMPTRAASGALSERPAERDADSVRRLREAGAVILGKLNMHELAVGTTSATSLYGPVRNPWNPDHIAGGSSGGSGAAVAAGFCYGALSTDTGGSIRIPAAACGVVGMKPTHGLVNLDGVVLVSASHDHVGPICRTVADAALMLQSLCDNPAIADFRNTPTSAFRIGILQNTDKFCDGAALNDDVSAAFGAAVARIASLVAETIPADVPYPDLGPIIDVEAAAFHQTLDWTKLQPATRAGFEDERAAAPSDRTNLLDGLARFRADFASYFNGFDLVVLPTLPAPAMLLSDAADPFAFEACTFAFSQAGAPAISVPCGFSSRGLPIGLMIAGPPGADAAVLALAAAYESAAGWKGRRPPL